MFEKFMSTDGRDFRQRYQGSYGFFRDNDKPPLLVKLVEVHHERDPFVRFVDKDDESYILNADAVSYRGFDFIPPRSAWKNTSRYGGVLAARLAQRQWSRGICDGNTSFSIPGQRALRVEFGILEALFVTEAPTFEVAYAFMKEQQKEGTRVCTALSTNFGLDSKGNVFLFDTMIGSYQEKSGLFTVRLTDDKLFSTEIRDAFKRNNKEVVIE